jgi:hypothetical protein
MLKFQTKAITAKVEGTYGTDSTPAGATDAVLARNMTVKPLRLLLDRRDFVLPYFGNQGQLVAGKFCEVDFEVELAGGGAAGTAPKYGPLLKGCGLSETINAGVSVVYAPVSPAPGAEVSLSIYFYVSGRLHKILGSLGSVAMVLEAGKIPLYRFHFVGLYVLPSDTALPALTLTGWQKPLAVNNANTTPATLFAFAAKFRRMEFDLGNKLAYRNLPNSEAVRFVDRNSSASFAFEGELVAGKDWWTIVNGSTLGAFTATHGTAAGNKVTIAAPNVQLLEPSLGAEDDIVMETYPADLTVSTAGNDELSITVL